MYKDFGYEDDIVIQSLERSMEELKKAKLDYPGPPKDEELPHRPFGSFIEPTFERKIGRRAEEFSQVEKATTENVELQREKAAREAAEYPESHISVENGGNVGGDVGGSVGGVESSEPSELAGTDSENECTRL